MINKPEFYEKLRTLLNSGINVRKALGILRARERGALKEALGGIIKSIEEGESLADSLSSYSKHFTPFEISIIRSGEITGGLERNLKFLIDYLRKAGEWKRKIVTGLIYPFILFHAAVLLPPLSILIMEGFRPYARAVSGPFIVLYLFFAAFFILRKIIMKSPPLSLFISRVLWRVPVTGRVQRNLALARFLKSLGFALKAGLNADKALRISSDSAGNPVVEAAVPVNPLSTLKTRGIAGVLQSTRLFPGMYIDMIHTGEESGSVDDSLLYLADTLEKQADTLMQRLTIILPVLVYLGVAVYIAGTILRFYAGLYSDITAF